MAKTNSMKIKFSKFNGAGNSFIIVDELEGQISSRSELAKKLCALDLNGPTDGLLFIEKLNHLVYQWDFYNSDGSSAEMCGNAARCMTRFLSEKENLQKQKIQIKTLAGPVYGVMNSEHHIDITMPLVQIENEQDSFMRINTGVPHLIYPLSSISEAKMLKAQAGQLRQKWNANITFVTAQGDDQVAAITFERGVEDFTLACGTGAVAAAIWQMLKHPDLQSCQVEMPGGRLTVNWDKKNEPHLIGSAIKELENELMIEDKNEST